MPYPTSRPPAAGHANHARAAMQRPSKTVIQHLNALQERGAVVLDTETTGRRREDVVIDIAVVDLAGDVLLNQLIRSPFPVPWQAKRVHGISNEMLQNQPTFDEVWPELVHLVGKRPILAYNADFDWRLLTQTITAHALDVIDFEWHCAMRLYQDYAGLPTQCKLVEACARLGVTNGDQHRALGDAFATRAVVLAMTAATP